MLKSKSNGDVLFLLLGAVVGKLLPGDLDGIREHWEDQHKRPWLINAGIVLVIVIAVAWIVTREE